MSSPLSPREGAHVLTLQNQPMCPAMPSEDPSTSNLPFPLRKDRPSASFQAASDCSPREGDEAFRAIPSILVPTSLAAKERKLYRTSRLEEKVASGSSFSEQQHAIKSEKHRFSSTYTMSHQAEGSETIDDQGNGRITSNVDADIRRRSPSFEMIDHPGTRKRAASKQRVQAEEHPIKECKKRRISDASESPSDDGEEWCAICLQSITDPTIVGECGHKGFCFECINVWANQARKCPLCTAAMATFLLHKLDGPVGPKKFFLPPLPSVKPTSHFIAAVSSSHLPPRPSGSSSRHRGPDVTPSERSGTPMNGDVWAQIQAERRGNRAGSEDVLERAIEKRRLLYQNGLYAKHVASNTFTRFKPIPTPRQFRDNPEMIQRATAFLRRELRVWRNMDVEFLTTYIVSLMRTMDIRTETAVTLLAAFLDPPGSQGRDRIGAEHFVHEVYSYLRSPYRDLAVYDAVAQYDPIPDMSHEEEDEETEQDHLAEKSVARAKKAARPDQDKSIRIKDRQGRIDDDLDSWSSDSASDFDLQSPSRSPLLPRSPSRSPPPELWKTNPRRWSQHDSYIPPRSPQPLESKIRRNRGDHWEDPDLEENMAVGKKGRRKGRSGPTQVQLETAPHRTVHRRLRGWSETEDSNGPVQKASATSGLDDKGSIVTNGGLSIRMNIRGVGGNMSSEAAGEYAKNAKADIFAVEDSVRAGNHIPNESSEITFAANKAKGINPASRDKRAEIREKLLGKLVREKLARQADKHGQLSSTIQDASTPTTSIPVTALTEAEKPKSPADASIQDAEAEARAKVLLKIQKNKNLNAPIQQVTVGHEEKSAQNTTSHLFWPDKVSQTTGTVWGWKVNETGTAIVVADVTDDNLGGGSRINSQGTSEELSRIGVARQKNDNDPQGHVIGSGSDDGLEIVVNSQGRPAPSPGCQPIIYHPPNPHRLRFLSLEPILPNKVSKHNIQLSAQLSSLEQHHGIKLNTHGQELDILDRSIRLINQAFDARRVPDRSSSSYPVGEICSSIVFALGRPIASIIWMFVFGVATLLQTICATPFIPSSFGKGTSIKKRSLADFSITCSQFAVRSKQALEFPARWRESSTKKGDTLNRSLVYIDFYNTVWLIANDIIVGYTLGSLTYEYAQPASTILLDLFQRYAVTGTKTGLAWLDDWPVGLKLVTPISRLYCQSLTDFADFWGRAIDILAPFFVKGIIILSYVSSFGATFFFAVVGDLIAAATAHLWLGGQITRRLWRWELSSLYSLWNLFRGKRWNDLRQRVDDFEYQVDQIYLGTLFFTVALFLLPTISVYYLYFAMILSIVYVAQGGIKIAMEFMNSFPLFALVLKMKEPSRVPGGIEFERGKDGCLVLKNKPASFAQIFGRKQDQSGR